MISIHPPRAGWDPLVFCVLCSRVISIHPPRAGWDAEPNLYKGSLY